MTSARVAAFIYFHAVSQRGTVVQSKVKDPGCVTVWTQGPLAGRSTQAGAALQFIQTHISNTHIHGFTCVCVCVFFFLPSYEYPSMDQLSETLPLVLKHFG